MKRAKLLQFKSFSIKKNICIFTYIVDGISYTISLNTSINSNLNPRARQIVLINLGMCYLIDIAQIIFPLFIKINFPMTELQLDFWKTTYEELTREKLYFYKENLDLLQSGWQAKIIAKHTLFHLPKKRNQIALCMTGGKDSIALLKILHKRFNLMLCFLELEYNIFRKKAYERLKREFSTLTINSNREDSLIELACRYNMLNKSRFSRSSTHLQLVFSTLLLGNKCKYVLIGNEYGSNFSDDIIYQGLPVNHQQPKSLYYAIKINNYLHRFVTPDFNYFSPFFGLYEYKTASYFFKDKNYLDIWTSCNNAEAVDAKKNFCSNCPKCAFTYLVSLMYVPDDFLSKYFSNNMLEKLNLYKPMMGMYEKKPLVCIGDKKEVWLALAKLMQKAKYKNTKTIKYFKKYIWPIIKNNIAKIEKEVTSVQRIALKLPKELENEL